MKLFNPEDGKHVAAEEVIFREGDPGDEMYAIIEGEVELMVGGKTVGKLGVDDIFGEMAVIDCSDRSATAIARTDCILRPIDQAQFLLLIQQTPAFALYVMEVLAKRLRDMDARL